MQMKLVRRDLQKQIGVLNPQKRPSNEIPRHTDFYKPIRAGVLKAAQFPDQLTDSKGVFHKPNGW
jgi:hypothetical protein